VSKSQAYRIVKLSSSPELSKKRGRPSLLTPHEDAGLVAYIVWLERSGFPAEKSQVEEAIMELLRS
ncbi:hypothetical protein B0T10DRAFT_205468, partial [Thelonectria olida]